MAGQNENLVRVHIFVSGRVQGVFFRSRTCDEAQKLDLVGWVKNTEDDRVEIVAEGEKDKLEEFLAWCKKGPLFARVENVEATWQESTGEFQSFGIVY